MAAVCLDFYKSRVSSGLRVSTQSFELICVMVMLELVDPRNWYVQSRRKWDIRQHDAKVEIMSAIEPWNSLVELDIDELTAKLALIQKRLKESKISYGPSGNAGFFMSQLVEEP